MKQTAWLNAMDSDLKNLMGKLIKTRHSREIACTARLMDMVGEKIEDAVPIREEWIVASDAITVFQRKLVLAPEADLPLPSCNEFYSDKLNEEQTQVLSHCISEITTGQVCIEEDVEALLYRILDFKAGPLVSTRISETAVLSHLVLPKNYRQQKQQLLEVLVPRTLRDDVDEHLGIVSSQLVKDTLLSVGPQLGR